MKRKRSSRIQIKTIDKILKEGLQKCSPSFFEQILEVFKNKNTLWRRSVLIIVLNLLILLPCFAQSTIQGTIKSVANDNILEGAQIYCRELNGGTVANEKGEYSLELSRGTYLLKFSFLGYETIERSVIIGDSPIHLNIRLKESDFLMEDVLVIGKSEARRVHEKAMPVSILEINKVGGAVSSMSDVLLKTSGVKLRNSGGVGSSSRLSIRGLEGKRIGIFMDGLPLADNSDYNMLNSIPVDLIKHIEVYKGIVPAKFGGTAIGGAVNIVLKEYPSYYCEAKYTNSSYNTHNASIGLKRRLSNSGYLFGVSGGYTYSDNNYTMELPLHKGVYVERDHDEYQREFLGASFSSEKWWFDNLDFSAAFTTARKEIQGVEYNIQHAQQNTDVVSISNQGTKKALFTDGLELEINNIYSYSIFQFIDTASYRYRWDRTKYTAASKFGGEIGNDANSTYNIAHNFIQRTNLNYIINESNAINFNSQYNYIEGTPTDSLRDKVLGYKTNYNSVMYSWVGGLSHEYNSQSQKLANIFSAKFYHYNMNTSKLRRISSTEVDKIDVSKSDFGVSNAIRYRFTPSFMIKASLAYDVRLPNESELLGDGFLIAPATDLQPEQSKNVNLSFSFDKVYNGSPLQIEMNLFYMHLTNMIRFTGGMLQFQYQNFGEMRTLGAEIDIKWDATPYLFLYANGTYQDLRDIREYEHGTVPNFTKGDRMPNIPYLMANAGFELHRDNLLGRNTESRLMADFLFVEEFYYNFKMSNLSEPKIPRQYVINLGIEQGVMGGAMVVGFQLNNVTNVNMISEFNRPLPGRNYSLKIRYIWKKY